MLTVEQMGRITKEVTLGLPPTLHTPDANTFREQITKDVADIIRQGYIVEIPGD